MLLYKEYLKEKGTYKEPLTIDDVIPM